MGRSILDCTKAIAPSLSNAAEFITDLPVSACAARTRPQITAIPRVSRAVSAASQLAGYERRPLNQIARRVSADREFREKDEAGASAPRLGRKVDDLGCVAGKVSDRGIDLAERNLHCFSVKRECAVAKSGGRVTLDQTHIRSHPEGL